MNRRKFLKCFPFLAALVSVPLLACSKQADKFKYKYFCNKCENELVIGEVKE